MSIQVATDGDFNEALTSNDKVVVKYFANWCGSCKLFSPKFKRLSNDERFAEVTFLDVNAEENPEARKQAGVNSLPFFAVFKGGKLVEGAATSLEPKVVEMIESLS
ncbi:thioredoxin family protein [Bacteroidia bacterium]|nr:thioredoxin family protein [Bacteroidia bacterium]